MSSRTVTILFPDGDIQFWLTDRLFVAGDKVDRDGQTWIVTSIGNPDRNGNAMAITVRPKGDSAAE